MAPDLQTAKWRHIHADWWQDDQGNEIHRVEVDEDVLYHCHFAGSSLPWNAVALDRNEAMAVFDDQIPEKPRWQ
ncbi:hypothetical protein [Halomonas cupida]|uniref:Uncharacterized protein n=1 Tax=Halomonas cupida TaxID=44933 RepID=A0A1M7HW55_9GAMM|nr:hypothetical protein [Halomonas cupida]GEN23915.1 hypothetical protein HCU01_18640 [Halomonas cupida]SHM32563.1 hypothetical protein SAMN05660971_02701 [Halomonas cupida]